MIEKTAVYRFGRTTDVTAKDAILYVIDNLGPQQPTELFRILDYEFVPSYYKDNIQQAFHELIRENVLVLTSDRFAKRP